MCIADSWSILKKSTAIKPRLEGPFTSIAVTSCATQADSLLANHTIMVCFVFMFLAHCTPTIWSAVLHDLGDLETVSPPRCATFPSLTWRIAFGNGHIKDRWTLPLACNDEGRQRNVIVFKNPCDLVCAGT